MKIYVDADACPVKLIVVNVAKEKKLQVFMVADTSHVVEDGYSDVITVDKAADSVDFVILKYIKTGDVVVTQDYGLASMALAKGCFVINQNGFLYDDANIDMLLMQRHINKKIRRGGGKTMNPSKRVKDDDVRFEECFRRLLEPLV